MSRPNDRSGASAVEMALVLPVLLLLGIGGVEGGRALSMSIAVSSAARAGSDWGATHRFTDDTQSSWESKIRSEVAAELELIPTYDAADLQTSIATNKVGESVRVTVSTTYLFRSVIDWPGLPGTWTLHRSVTVCQFR